MHYSTEAKAKHLADWRLSGKSISAYVKEQGLVRWTFHKWLKADRAGGPCFVEVTAHAAAPAPCVPSILVEKEGVKIHIPLGMNTAELRALIEGLGVWL
jgi:hypothetical protein